MKICLNCGSQYADSCTFCENCGAVLSSSEPADTLNKQELQPETGVRRNSSRDLISENKMQKKILILLILVLVLTCFALVLLAVIVLSKPEISDTENETFETENIYASDNEVSETEISEESTENITIVDLVKSKLPSDVTPLSEFTYNGHTYLIVKGEKTWHESAAVCSKAGGYLAVIEDEEEQKAIEDFVYDAVGMNDSGVDNVWIGGFYSQLENKWKWTNGATFEYTNWDSRENKGIVYSQPDNYFGDEFFIRFAVRDIEYADWNANKGKWNDSKDGGDSEASLNSFAFIIEMDS